MVRHNEIKMTQNHAFKGIWTRISEFWQKKVMEKIKIRLKLYQLSYPAKLQNGAIFHYSF